MKQTGVAADNGFGSFWISGKDEIWCGPGLLKLSNLGNERIQLHENYRVIIELSVARIGVGHAVAAAASTAAAAAQNIDGL